MKPAIRIVFFDLDDTLIHEERMVAKAFADTCAVAAVQRNIDSTALEQSIRRIAREMWWELQGDERWGTMIGISSWEALYGDFRLGDAPLLRKLRAQAPAFRMRAWQSALRECRIDDEPLARQLAETFRTRCRSRPTLFPDALEVLRHAKRSYRLGMITNGAPDVQTEKIDGAGIRGYFDSITISGEIGVGKPERAIFDYAVQSMSASPKECVMVGNSFERDVEGAREAEMRAVWLNLHNEEPPQGNVGFDTIVNLRELNPLLERYAR